MDHLEDLAYAIKGPVIVWGRRHWWNNTAVKEEADEQHDMDGWEEFDGVNQLFLFRANLANGLGETALAIFRIRWIWRRMKKVAEERKGKRVGGGTWAYIT